MNNNTPSQILSTKINTNSFVETRSFLMANVDKILENISSRRESKKIATDDLFDFGSELSEEIATTEVQSPWKTDFEELSKLEILMMEKEILGLYVSGNPLQEYKKVENWLREVSGHDDVYIVLVEKIRKIFTKVGNKMMLSVDVTSTLDIPLDGVVYTKKAMELSPILQEKQIFLAKAKVEEPKSKKKEEVVVGDDEEIIIEDVKEFVENTKFIFESVVPFSGGLLELLDKTESPVSTQRRDILQKIDWISLLKNPNEIITKEVAEEIDDINTIIPPFILKLKANLNPELVKEIKSKLLKSIPENGNQNQELIKVQIEIEHLGIYKKVATEFWLDKKYYTTILPMVS